MTACFKLMKALHPHKQLLTDDPHCNTCVYHSMNLDRSLYDDKGGGDSPKNGCSLDFIPGDKGCNEMRTSNCSIRKSRTSPHPRSPLRGEDKGEGKSR